MANIWTSERAAKVLDKIGWPTGKHWVLQLDQHGNTIAWTSKDYEECHFYLLFESSRQWLPTNLAAALCRDWCASYLRQRYWLDIHWDEGMVVVVADLPNEGELHVPTRAAEEPSFDECLLELLEWHLAQAAHEAKKGEGI